jgi:DNA mismatch endonuclease (patch repair protein)
VRHSAESDQLLECFPQAAAHSCLGAQFVLAMVDTISVKQRSENMRRIRSKGTKPEMEVRRLVHTLGYRFRLHSPKLPGKPDLVFPGLKKIIEVRGCFWHQHKVCIDAHIPKSKVGYWRPKLQRNVLRDQQNLKKLRELGWKVLVVWECEVNASSIRRINRRLKMFLQQH